MRKVKYKPKNVNELNWAAMKQKFQNCDVTFSIDVAKNAFVGLLSNQEQTVLQLIKWTHPQDTLAFIEHLHQDLGAARFSVVMESTGTYGDALRWQFTKRGIPVYQVNPKHTHDQAESFDGVPSSHDAKAACIIADLHLRGCSQQWNAPSIEQRDLRGLVNELEIHQQIHRANLNRLSALLIRHWPELETIIDIKTVSVLSLLSKYGDPQQVIQHSKEALVTLHKAGRAGLKAEKSHAIVASAKTSLGLPCSPGERDYIKQLATDLLRTHKASADVEKRMAKATSDREELAPLIALCGKVTTVVFIALLGDLRQYASAKSLLNAMGMNLKECSSGQHKGRLSITKRGCSKVRFYLYWLALRLIHKDPLVKAWYERKVARDGGRKNGCAIVAVMRKVVKALYYVAKGDAFDSQKLFNAAHLALIAK